MLTSQQKHVLDKNGYIFLPEFLPNLDIVSCGKFFGEIIPPHSIKNEYPAEKLTPKEKKEFNKNTYSSIFGLGEFPYHTDLAHLPTPPKYLLLRCLKGAKDVKTKILESKNIIKEYDFSKLKRSIFKPRDKLNSRVSLPLPLIFGNEFIRWDSIFLQPANKNAEDFHEWMSIALWDGIEKSHSLSVSGDTLLINNWKNLHSRSSVSEEDRIRVIERIYLSEMWN